MTADDWKRVQAILDAALQRDPEEREAFLDNACAGRPQLREAVRHMLDAHDAGPSHDATVGTPIPVAGGGEPRDGQTLGPYIIRHEIGRGGMGVVYLADDTRLSRRVALKAIAHELSGEIGSRERLRQEARAAAALSHPGIATVYALEEIGGELYLACEYVPGQTLRAMLDAGPLPIGQVIDLALQLARALAAAHLHGIVHRDLKPENVVATPAGAIKVLDFGVARIEGLTPKHLTQTGTVVGTPAYMAPEQLRGEPVDFRTDLFTLGVVLYELASGTNPFEATTGPATIGRILDFEPAALSTVVTGGGPRLDQIVATCLRKPPPERYRSTTLLVADLEQLQGHISSRHDRPVTSGWHESPDAGLRAAAPLTPRWWWAFHQIITSTIYVVMLYPAWHVRSWLAVPFGTIFLFVALACAAVATSVRMHLMFTSRFYPAQLPAQRVLARPWTRWSDVGFAACLLAAAPAIDADHPAVAVLFVTVSIYTAVASFFIEPATIRAAFREETEEMDRPARNTSASKTPDRPRPSSRS